MARKPTLTAAALADLVSRTDEMTMEIMTAVDDVNARRVETIDPTSDYARAMAQLASHAAAMASGLLILEAMQKKDRELERLRAAAT